MSAVTSGGPPIRKPIHIEAIAAQRKRGWTEFHPEDYCHRCGGPNISWFALAEVWNPVMRPTNDEAWKWNEIICPICFDTLAGGGTWQLTADLPDPAGPLAHLRPTELMRDHGGDK